MITRELCRRLYVELFYVNQQLTMIREDGEPAWTTGRTVRDVLADAKAALEATDPKNAQAAGAALIESARARNPYWDHDTQRIVWD